MSTQNPFGSVEDSSLVEETAIDTEQPELIMTPEQFDRLSNKVVRRLAAKFESDDVNGRMAKDELIDALEDHERV